MKLDYFTLISPDPLHIHGVGDIKSPTLSEISKLESKINTYNYYVTILLLNIGSYYEEFEKERNYLNKTVSLIRKKISNLGQELFDDDSKVILQLKNAVEMMSGIVQRQDQVVDAAKEELEKH